MWRMKLGAVWAVTILLAIALVISGADRASGQADLHVVMPAGAGRDSLIDVVGGPGLDVGDGVVGRGPVMDGGTGEHAGSVYFECTVMRKIRSDDEGLWRCSYHLRLADGAIVLQGLDPRGLGASTFAVLGGTKAYAAASGDAVFTDSDEGTDMVISLT
jgi:hypothetical protein